MMAAMYASHNPETRSAGHRANRIKPAYFPERKILFYRTFNMKRVEIR